MRLNKLLLVISITSLTAAPAMASDWFIGGSVGSQKNVFEESHTTPKPEQLAEDFNLKVSEYDVVYSIRAGKYFGNSSEHRVYGTYSYNSGTSKDLGNGDFTQQNFLASYDYLVPLGQSSVSWFIGATAGYAHTEMNGSHLGSKGGFVYGGQTGFMMDISENVSAELGYRYLKQDYTKGVTDNLGHTTELSLNDSQQAYFGIDYRF